MQAWYVRVCCDCDPPLLTGGDALAMILVLGCRRRLAACSGSAETRIAKSGRAPSIFGSDKDLIQQRYLHAFNVADPRNRNA
jgi:hypothetical protein